MKCETNIRNILLVSLPRTVVNWYSQTLVLNSLISFWSKYCAERGINYKIIESLPNEIRLYSDLIQAADLIVFVWNGPVFLKVLRGDLKFKKDSLIYLAGEGSRGFAYSIESNAYITSKDTFICSSEADQVTLSLSLPEAKSIILPYIVENTKTASKRRSTNDRSNETQIRLFYIGRISEQKNLHALFLGLKVFSMKNPLVNFVLDIYGFDDNLGSPNMHLIYPNYLEFLKELARLLDVSKYINWNGFLNNFAIKLLVESKTHIFLSTSLYSEECFGLAPLDSLINGNAAVLTAWGGFLDFKEKFNHLVELIPVRQSLSGPYICPFDIAEKMQKQTEKYTRNDQRDDIPVYYSLEMKKTKIDRLLYEIASSKSIIKYIPHSEWFKKIQRQIKLKNKEIKKSLNELSLRIYENYQDSLLIHPFRIYGMNMNHGDFNQNIRRSKSIMLPPWVDVIEDQILVRDPHRGNLTLKIKRSEDDFIYMAQQFPNKTIPISGAIAEQLYNHGYLFLDTLS